MLVAARRLGGFLVAIGQVERLLFARSRFSALRDILGRRMRLEITDWEAAKVAAPKVAALLGDFFEWDDTRVKLETEAYLATVDGWERAAKG